MSRRHGCQGLSPQILAINLNRKKLIWHNENSPSHNLDSFTYDTMTITLSEPTDLIIHLELVDVLPPPKNKCLSSLSERSPHMYPLSKSGNTNFDTFLTTSPFQFREKQSRFSVKAMSICNIYEGPLRKIVGVLIL